MVEYIMVFFVPLATGCVPLTIGCLRCIKILDRGFREQGPGKRVSDVSVTIWFAHPSNLTMLADSLIPIEKIYFIPKYRIFLIKSRLMSLFIIMVSYNIFTLYQLYNYTSMHFGVIFFAHRNIYLNVKNDGHTE